MALLAKSFERQVIELMALGLLPAVALHLLSALPDGRLGTRRADRRCSGYVAGAAVGLVDTSLDSSTAWLFVALWAATLLVGLQMSHRRYVAATTTDRRRMQWVGWALSVTAELMLAIVALRLIADWPAQPMVVALATTVLVPASLVAGTHVRMIARVDRLLTHTVALAGLTALVVVAYIVVVVALGRVSDERRAIAAVALDGGGRPRRAPCTNR